MNKDLPGKSRLHVIRRASLAFAAFLLASLAARADSPDRMIEIRAQFMRATKAQMAEAFKMAGISESSAMALSPAQFEALKSQLKERKMDFFSDLRAITSDGHHAAVDAVREIRYPTEYVPSEKEPGKSVPTAFEMRNAGVELEFEPVIGPNDLIDLTIQPTVTTFLGFVDYSSAKTAHPVDQASALDELLKAPLSEGGIWQPIFSTFKITTSVTLKNADTLCFEGRQEPAIKSLDPQVFVFITAKVVTPN